MMMMMMMTTLPSVCYVITCNFYLCLRKHTSDTFCCWREAPWVVCCSSCVYLTPPNGNCRNQELFARVYFILAQDSVRLPPAMIYWANGMKEWTNVATLPGHQLACYIIFFCTDAFFIRQERLWGRSRHIKSVLESSSEGNLPTKGPGHIHSQFAWHSLCESVTFDSRRQCLPLFWLIRLKWSCSTHTFVYIADQVSY